MLSSQPQAARWDAVGIGLSGLCAVHCLLMAFILALLPLWPVAEALAGWLHPVLVLPLMLVTGAAMRAGVQQHGSRTAPALLGLGLALVLVATLHHSGWSVHAETLGTLSGSLLLIAGHGCNRHACHSQ